MNKKIVVFGGGTGITQLLSGLKLFPVDITAVIAVSDNGSSTGKLREEFSMPAMGDIRKVIISLSDVSEEIKNLLAYRFNTYSDLNGHPIGNLIMVGMYQMCHSLKDSIEVLSRFLNIRHKVLPLSEDNLVLMGETVDHEIVEGEEEITKYHKRYCRLFYKQEPKVLDEVLTSIKEADVIIFSMGSLFTSIIPHLLAKDVIKALDASKAKIIYTCNAVTQPGETDDFKVSDHVNVLNSYLGTHKVDVVVASKTKIPKKIVDKYATSEQKDLVVVDPNNIKNTKLVIEDMLVIENNVIRHDVMKLATLLFNEIVR